MLVALPDVHAQGCSDFWGELTLTGAWDSDHAVSCGCLSSTAGQVLMLQILDLSQ